MKFVSNKEITKMLREVSAAYQAKGENRFKVIAYENAATTVEHATSELKDLWETGQLKDLPGLGQSMQKHLDELFKTGKVKHFDEVKKSVPQGMFDLLDIGGLGPKSAYKLASVLNIKNIKDLETAAKNNKIREIAGFGAKSEKEILTAISELQTKSSSRHLLTEVYPVAQRILNYLREHDDCERAEPLGSLRRMVPTIGDIDIAVASANPKNIIEHFKKFKEIKRVLDAGPRKSSALLYSGIQIDVIVQSSEAFGALLQHFTGSKYHNITLREMAIKNGLSVSDYGIKKKNKLHEFKSEEDFYNFLGLDYIEPELREDTGEIKAAANHTLPYLVRLNDIRGDLHLHSSYPIEPSHDFGKHSFEEIVKKARSLQYEYVGLSDHSPGVSTHSKTKIVDLIKKRRDKIEQLKYSHKDIGILNLLEIDISIDGSLSVPQEGLDLLDGVIAGIHSGHNQSKANITKRLLNAIKTEKVKIISHPTGRLLLKREASDADCDEVFKACANTNTFLEINSWPTRLDLPDNLVRKALDFGVRFVVNTDAHDISHMNNMKFGLSVARRGWCTKENIVNTLGWLEFRKSFGLT